MMESPDTNAFVIYKRLLGYLRPYKTRVVIGIVAGVLAGGSIFTLLQAGSELLVTFDKRTLDHAVAQETSDVPAKAQTKENKKVERIEAWTEKLGFQATNPDGSITWVFFLLSAIGVPLIVAFRALTIYLNRYHMRWVASRVTRDLRDELFRRLGGQSLKFFGKSDVGQLISRCTNDITLIERVLSASVSHLTRAPIEILAAVLFLLHFSMANDLLGLMLGLGLAFPLLVLPIVILGRLVRRHMRRALSRVSLLVSRMHENFTGIKIVKAFDMEKAETERFQGMNRDYFKSLVSALKAELLMTPLMEAVAIVLGLIFLVACFAKQVPLPEILAMGLAAIVAYRPIKQLAKINAEIQRGAAALESVLTMLDTDVSLTEAPDAKAVEAFNERVTFDHVSFQYDDEGSMTVQDIELDMPRGSVVAVVGETGSGKSTLANLLARFYDPLDGRILLDGVDLREIKIASLRRLIGVVTQETILFNDTIAANIAYGTPEATQAQIEEAARQANAHEFIVAEPGGYERMAGEKGSLLSGGEKQRIAIARAILRNPPILILDEATSALDTVTERLVQEAINHVMENRTVFAIAHRLSTVKHANEILLLDKGRIIERGTHDELYAAGGGYRRLCDMQVLDS